MSRRPDCEPEPRKRSFWFNITGKIVREITCQSGLSVNRHYRLDVHEPLGTLSPRTDIPVVVSEERYADEGSERVGELFGQNFAVILRKRSSAPQKSAATAAEATSACFGSA